MSDKKINEGDEFRDLDPRNGGERVVKVKYVHRHSERPEKARAAVVVIAAPAYNPTAVGRTSYIRVDRLLDEKLFQKVSH
jgi:hypothetical protein